jgi:hypothetical protein
MNARQIELLIETHQNRLAFYNCMVNRYQSWTGTSFKLRVEMETNLQTMEIQLARMEIQLANVGVK